MPATYAGKPFTQLFDKVLVGAGCWEWLGKKAGAGKCWYGQLKISGRSVLAHRRAHELMIGPIPPGMCVMHSCDNPGCVNPAHLSLGTTQENTADKVAKGRARGAHPGETHHHAKLLDQDVMQIRALLKTKTKQREIAKLFSVQPNTVSRIKTGARWGHLQG